MHVLLEQIAPLLANIAGEVQGINRHRYARSLTCLEELVEALAFREYLCTQTLMTFSSMSSIVDTSARRGVQIHGGVGVAGAGTEDVPTDDDVPDVPEPQLPRSPPSDDLPDLPMQDDSDSEDSYTPFDDEAGTLGLTHDDYLNGVFDLTGEMMRFATTSAALTGTLVRVHQGGGGRTIVQDMQDLGSFFRMLPPRSDKSWMMKMDVLLQSVRKVERIGYDRVVRGSERPEGWAPDTDAEGGGAR